jgi:RecA-family ATPase
MKGVTAIEAWVKSKKNPRMVTVDVLETFRSRVRNGKENQYSADYETIKALQALASKYNIAILIIHHVRKGSDDGIVARTLPRAMRTTRKRTPRLSSMVGCAPETRASRMPTDT